MIEYQSVSKRKVDVSELEIGMFVCEVDRPWRDTPLLFQGFPLLTADDVFAVQSSCQFVFIDEFRQVRFSPEAIAEAKRKVKAKIKAKARQARPSSEKTPRTDPSRRSRLSVEVQQAKLSHRKTSLVIRDLFADIQLGKGIDTVVCRKVVRNNLKSILRNESALLWLSRIKNQDNYTSQHCLAVSVMAMGFGRHLGIEGAELEELGLAGLLHDVGKIKVDQQLLNKPGALTRAEFEHIKNHAGFGYELLVGHEDLPASVAEAAYGHHERLDGSGYPRELMGDLIPRITRIVSIVDCFDAITSNRIYDRARPVKDAFKVLLDMRMCQFDAELVMRFIEWLGIFPVGTLVELHTGEVGLVVEKHPQLQLRPKVVVLIDEAGKRCTPRFLDLAKITVDAQGRPYRITAGLPDGALGLFMSDPDVQALLDNRELGSLDDEDEVLDVLSHWERVPTQGE